VIDPRREARLLVFAAQLLTRLPTPAQKLPAPDALARSAKYFPLVGMLIGAMAASILLLSGLGLKGALPALLAVGAGALITGAFHEDGLADAADGLGGGATPARRLEIMKDSRTGTYGVVALALVLAIKVAALTDIEPRAAAAVTLIAAHAGGRAAAVVVMARQHYARDPDDAKLKPSAMGVTLAETLVAIVLALLPLLLMQPGAALAAVLTGGMAAAGMALVARRLIGGYTGDVLGAVEQVFEAGFLVGASFVWSGL